ncbi:MAG: phosphoribosylanthranilate isomerase [Oscillospiraceae bacterium]|nr:phosphoribosylanthranilate isomerase [Oscillospiraceae bacterium]
MTRIKLCGLSRLCDIKAANELKPEYIGFVFAPKSRRYVTPEKAQILKQALDSQITAVGVFADEAAETVAELLNMGTIDIAQLHGRENKEYIEQLRNLTDKPIIKAFRIETASDIADAEKSASDYILLDSGAGTGTVFDWKLIQNIRRPYFLAGGFSPDNVEEAVTVLHPFAVDVSTGIETDGLKDKCKMAEFVAAVKKEV